MNHYGKMLSIVGLVFILVSFIMPWIRLPLLGSMSMLDMFTKGVAEKPGEEPEEAIITTMSKNDSLIALSVGLYLLSILLGLLGTKSPKLTALAGIMAILSGAFWITSIESRRTTIIARLLLNVEYGPYIVLIGGCLMAAGALYWESIKEEKVKEEKETGSLKVTLGPGELIHIPANKIISKWKGAKGGELILTTKSLIFRPSSVFKKKEETHIPLDNIINMEKQDHLFFKEVRIILRDGTSQRFIVGEKEREILIKKFKELKNKHL